VIQVPFTSILEGTAMALSRRSRLRAGRPLLVAGLLAAVLTTAACGTDSTAQRSGAAGTASSEPTAAGDVTTGESAGVRFVSTRFHYRVDAPGTMTEAGDGTATAARGVEQLTIRVVSGATAADPSAFAQSDAAGLPGNTTQYKVVDPLATISLAGRPVVKLVYASSGINAVTGNTQDFVNARYYIPKDSSTLAVVTYSIVLSQYDPQGADDVVTTFQWQ
jgi:hypothetical protein